MRKHTYQLKKKHFSAIKLRLKDALNPLISSRKNLILSITTVSYTHLTLPTKRIV